MIQSLMQVWTDVFSLDKQVIALYRAVRFLRGKRGLGPIALVLLYIQQVISGCHFHPTVIIGSGLRLTHPVGIVLGKGVRIGNRVTIFQHVTLGSHGRQGEQVAYPVVDDDVTIYAGSIILGGIHIGQGAVIGAGTIVTRDVPAHGLVFGNPGRLHGFVCACGQKLSPVEGHPADPSSDVAMICPACHAEYVIPAADYALLAPAREA